MTAFQADVPGRDDLFPDDQPLVQLVAHLADVFHHRVVALEHRDDLAGLGVGLLEQPDEALDRRPEQDAGSAHLLVEELLVPVQLLDDRQLVGDPGPEVVAVAQRLDVAEFAREPVDHVQDLVAPVGSEAEGGRDLGDAVADAVLHPGVHRHPPQLPEVQNHGLVTDQPGGDLHHQAVLGDLAVVVLNPPARGPVKQLRRDRVARPDVLHEAQPLGDLDQQPAVLGVRLDAELGGDVVDRDHRIDVAELDPQNRRALASRHVETGIRQREDSVLEREMRVGIGPGSLVRQRGGHRFLWGIIATVAPASPDSINKVLTAS